MKTLLLGFVLFLSSCSVLVPSGHVSDFKQVRDVSYEILMTNGTCSAVAISSTHLLTAGHCISELGQEVTVMDVDKGERYLVGKAFAVKDNDVVDLAIVVLKDEIVRNYASVSSTEPLQDEIVVVVGYPLGITEVVTIGRFQGLVDGHYLVTAQATFGNSGGGVFVIRDGKYELLGIGSYGAATNYGQFVEHLIFFVTNDTIEDFLGYDTEKEEYGLN